MKNSLDVKRCLLIFDKILKQGEKNGEKYLLKGLEAWTDFDGYNCYLSFNNVIVTIMFHSKYDIQFESQDALLKFEKKLQAFDLS